jgi:hypothetical protein
VATGRLAFVQPGDGHDLTWAVHLVVGHIRRIDPGRETDHLASSLANRPDPCFSGSSSRRTAGPAARCSAAPGRVRLAEHDGDAVVGHRALRGENPVTPGSGAAVAAAPLHHQDVPLISLTARKPAVKDAQKPVRGPPGAPGRPTRRPPRERPQNAPPFPGAGINASLFERFLMAPGPDREPPCSLRGRGVLGEPQVPGPGL